MLGSLIDVALRQRLLVFLAAIALTVWGIDAYRKIAIDAFPTSRRCRCWSPCARQGLAPEELESRVTAPIEIAMRGILISSASARPPAIPSH